MIRSSFCAFWKSPNVVRISTQPDAVRAAVALHADPIEAEEHAAVVEGAKRGGFSCAAFPIHPKDLPAIAAAFDQEAARLEALAKEHEKMAHSYRTNSSKVGLESASMHAHCAKLAKQYSEAAKENRGLAKEHRAMKEHAGHPM